MPEVEWPKDRWGNPVQNKALMEKAGYSEVEILRAAVYALGEALEDLPVGLCDMEVHFYYKPDRYCKDWPEELVEN